MQFIRVRIPITTIRKPLFIVKPRNNKTISYQTSGHLTFLAFEVKIVRLFRVGSKIVQLELKHICGLYFTTSVPFPSLDKSLEIFVKLQITAKFIQLFSHTLDLSIKLGLVDALITSWKMHKSKLKLRPCQNKLTTSPLNFTARMLSNK